VLVCEPVVGPAAFREAVLHVLFTFLRVRPFIPPIIHLHSLT
jgi:hypothetical protein